MLIVVLRTMIMYVTIILSMRVMGKRQIGELQPSELVTTILISNLASLPIEDTDISIIMGLVPIALIISIELFLSAAEIKSRFFSELITGRSKVVVRNGEVDQKILRELRFNIQDLLSALRAHEVFDLKQVKFALIETNGKISLFKNPGTARMMIPVVTDGKLNASALKFIGATEAWVSLLLESYELRVNEVLLLECNEKLEYNIVVKEEF